MASMRNWCSALFLVPLSLLTSHAASATDTVHAVAPGPASTAPTVRLPDGIRRTRSGRYTRDLCDHTKAHFCFSHVLLPANWTPDQPVPRHGVEGNSEPGGGANGMAPGDIMNAYNIPAGALANGKIVAILDSPDSEALSDLAAYRQQFGLPALPRCNGKPTGTLPACFAQVAEDGGASTGQDSGADADSETALDTQMISAACPDCSILLVEIGDNQGDFGDSDFVTGAQTAGRLGAVATSISIGGPEEQGGDPTGYTTPGHLVLAASGDFGYDLVDEGAGVATPAYPASAPDILSVGGTTLFSSGSSYGEAVWNDAPFGGGFSTGENGQDVTTSGCSSEFSAPSWQSAALGGSGCNMRATADVSAAAAFAYGGQLADIPVYQGGQWESVEGTSAASPMVAALLTRLGLAEQISSNIGWVYQNASAWNDLGSSSYPVDPQGSKTDAQDPSSCGKLCTAGPGWDGPSGVGTPNGTKLAALATGGGHTPDAGGGGTTGSSSVVTTSASSGGGATNTGGIGTGAATGGYPTGGASTGGAATGAPPGSGGLMPLSLTGPLGSGCAGSAECTSSICAEPHAGSPAVCTEACGGAAGAVCPSGFACTEGYCFAAPDADAGVADFGGSSGGGGCAVSASPSEVGFDWSGAGWLSLGLIALTARRRKAAR